MITVARMSKPEEAHLLRARLEAGGVQAFVQDEHTVQMDWLYSNAIGGVRVQIDECDLERAREIYQAPGGASVDEVTVHCPSCGSVVTETVEWPRRLSFFSAIVANLPLAVPGIIDRFHCCDCGHRWRQAKGEVSAAHDELKSP